MKNTSYDSIRAAGIAGTLAAIALSRAHGVEYGGWILRNGNRFTVSELVMGDSEGVMLEPPKADWKDTMAMFHTHTNDGLDNTETQWFSGDDVRNALMARRIAYLGSSITGEVRELDATSLDKFQASVEKKEPDPSAFRNNKGDPLTMFAILGKQILAGDHMSA